MEVHDCYIEDFNLSEDTIISRLKIKNEFLAIKERQSELPYISAMSWRMKLPNLGYNLQHPQ